MTHTKIYHGGASEYHANNMVHVQGTTIKMHCHDSFKNHKNIYIFKKRQIS